MLSKLLVILRSFRSVLARLDVVCLDALGNKKKTNKSKNKKTTALTHGIIRADVGLVRGLVVSLL